MAREILIINGHDWSGAIQSSGYGWTRNDLDSDQTKRPKNGVMRRDKIGTKRKLAFTTMPAPRETLAKLDDDLSGTSFETSLAETADGHEDWESATFGIIER